MAKEVMVQNRLSRGIFRRPMASVLITALPGAFGVVIGASGWSAIGRHGFSVGNFAGVLLGLLLGVFGWSIGWRPKVRLTDSVVVVVGVFRTSRLPFERVVAIRWPPEAGTLEVEADDGRTFDTMAFSGSVLANLLRNRTERRFYDAFLRARWDWAHSDAADADRPVESRIARHAVLIPGGVLLATAAAITYSALNGQ